MATTTRQHIEMTRLDQNGNAYILYPKNTLKDVHTSSTSGVTIEGKVNFFGTCSTAAATAAKTVSISGFSLVAGAHVTVVFTNGISVANATLNINSAGAKAIYNQGVALKANAIRANARVHMVYDGSYFHVISGASNSPYVTNANTTKFYLVGTPTNENGVPTAEHFDTGVYVSATSGELVATSFKGKGSDLTNLNAGNISSGTLAKERLATSGVTAGSYGPTEAATATHGGKIKVPKVTVDAYGRITGCEDIEYTLPSDNNTDTKVKNTLNKTAKAYITGTTTATTNTGEQVFDDGVYLDTTAGRLRAATMLATTYYLGNTSSYINASNYTGTAAKVGAISDLLVDSCASGSANGVTTKGLTANQGYLLQNQIDSLNSNLLSIYTYMDQSEFTKSIENGVLSIYYNKQYYIQNEIILISVIIENYDLSGIYGSVSACIFAGQYFHNVLGISTTNNISNTDVISVIAASSTGIQIKISIDESNVSLDETQIYVKIIG